MKNLEFAIGVVFALVSGIVNNVGNVIQKKAVNHYLAKELEESSKTERLLSSTDHLVLDEDLEVTASNEHIKLKMKDLLRSKLWIFGFGMQLVLATALFVAAQIYIGPTLTPALGSIGIIVLAFVGITNERLTWDEYLGLFMIIGSVVLLSFSGMSIDGSKEDYLENTLLIRVAVYTAAIVGTSVFCKIWARRQDRFEGFMLATVSGLCIALSNYWVSPLTMLIGPILSGKTSGLPTFDNHPFAFVVILWLVAVFVVIWSNVQAIYERQMAFKVGKATTMIPITHVPSHISPPVIYSFCFGLTTPYFYSMPMMIVAVVLLLVASFIFGKREAGTEAKKQENTSQKENPIDVAELRKKSILLLTTSPAGSSASPYLTRRSSPHTPSTVFRYTDVKLNDSVELKIEVLPPQF